MNDWNCTVFSSVKLVYNGQSALKLLKSKTELSTPTSNSVMKSLLRRVNSCMCKIQHDPTFTRLILLRSMLQVI